MLKENAYAPEPRPTRNTIRYCEGCVCVCVCVPIQGGEGGGVNMKANLKSLIKAMS